MSQSIPEKDWKYLRKLQPELLDRLCSRINQNGLAHLQSDKTEHEKFLAMYKHMDEADRVVAECFNNWARSSVWMKILLLIKYELLTDDDVKGLSKESQEQYKKSKELWKDLES